MRKKNMGIILLESGIKNEKNGYSKVSAEFSKRL
jgi:hypothetical protein